jgi:predicted metal-binding membrane protein
VVTITALAWLDLVRLSANMTVLTADARMHAAMGMIDTRWWSVADWFNLFVMWTVMMIGMMLPSSAPAILLVLRAYRKRGDRFARASASAFVSGHLFAWTIFSAFAAGVQIVLHRRALLGADMATHSIALGGSILLVAGMYQCLPVKSACLKYCRLPLRFLSMRWTDGTRGAFAMGLRLGAFCVGCCGALMAVLFAAGVMNLFWVAAIAGFVLLEKLSPRDWLVEYGAGILLMLLGLLQLVRGLAA